MKPGKAASFARFVMGHFLAVAFSVLAAVVIATPLAALTLHFGLPALFPSPENVPPHKDLGQGAAAALLATASFLLWFLVAFVAACRWALRRLDRWLLGRAHGAANPGPPKRSSLAQGRPPNPRHDA